MLKNLMRAKDPKISVILPVYNAEHSVAMSIDSILNQSFTDFELILIDDSSRDNSLKILEEYAKKDGRIVLLKNEKNLKLSKSLNRGIAEAKGQYIARMDADDYSYPDRFEKQYRFMQEHPEIGISGGTMEVVSSENKLLSTRRYYLTDDEIRKRIFYFSPFCHPAIMIRKNILDQVGGFLHDYNPAEDYELYFRIGKISKFGNLNDILLRYKLSPLSMTGNQTWMMERKSIQIRSLYFHSPQYRANFIQKLYNFLHFISLYILPSSIKVFIYQKLRDEVV